MIQHQNIIPIIFILLISNKYNVYGVFELNKCCPDGYSIEENYGYKNPEEFEAGNLHCRRDDENIYDTWIPRDIVFKYNKNVPEKSNEGVINNCVQYDVTAYHNKMFNISENGQLQLFIDEYQDPIVLDSNSFCLDLHLYKSGIFAMTCPCHNDKCVQYCCGENTNTLGLIDSTHNLVCNNPGNISLDNVNMEYARNETASNLQWVYRSELTLKHQCIYSRQKYLVPDENGFESSYSHVLKYREMERTNNYFIDKNAELHTNGHKVNTQHYCIAPSLDAEENIIYSAYFCDTAPFFASHTDVVVQSWFASIGALFSLLTIIGIFLSPELKKGIEGITLFAHCFFMLSAYVTLAVRPYIWSIEGQSCLYLAHILQFFLLSAFFWLNVRAVIIFTRFRSLETMLTRLAKNQKNPWLLPICIIYAFGVPIIVCVITAIAQNYSHVEAKIIWVNGKLQDEDHIMKAPDWLITPDLDDTTCWFGNALSRTMYYTLPMGVVLVVNLAMFISTVTSLLKLTKARNFKPNEDLRSDKRKLLLFIKMFIIMGLAWSGEFISFVNYVSIYYWYLSTLATTLRAIAIFVVFCCRKVVFDELRSSFNFIKKRDGHSPMKEETKGNSTTKFDSSFSP